jgi:hypothetical protein
MTLRSIEIGSKNTLLDKNDANLFYLTSDGIEFLFYLMRIAAYVHLLFSAENYEFARYWQETAYQQASLNLIEILFLVGLPLRLHSYLAVKRRMCLLMFCFIALQSNCELVSDAPSCEARRSALARRIALCLLSVNSLFVAPKIIWCLLRILEFHQLSMRVWRRYIVLSLTLVWLLFLKASVFLCIYFFSRDDSIVPLLSIVQLRNGTRIRYVVNCVVGLLLCAIWFSKMQDMSDAFQFVMIKYFGFYSPNLAGV